MPRTCGGCSFNDFDRFGIYADAAGPYWSLVAGGSGALVDPVDGPAGLTSWWTWGGASSTPGLLSASGHFGGLLPVLAGAPQTLSLVLDTATGRDADTAMASWGSLSNVVLTPLVGTVRQAPVDMHWTPSPFDPDGGTRITVDADGLQLTLAGRSFGAASADTQPQGIWGVAALLPGRDPVSGAAYTAYEIGFDYTLQSHDIRGAVPEPSALALMLCGVGLLAAVLRRAQPATPTRVHRHPRPTTTPGERP